MRAHAELPEQRAAHRLDVDGPGPHWRVHKHMSVVQRASHTEGATVRLLTLTQFITQRW